MKRRILESMVAVVVVVLLSCEVGCAKPEPKFAMPPAPTVTINTDETEAAAAKLKADTTAVIEAYKAKLREKLCPKP